MLCDHDASRASLSAFRATTTGMDIGDDVDSDGNPRGTLLYGTCIGCGSTIAIAIQEVRASVVATGEIVTSDFPVE